MTEAAALPRFRAWPLAAGAALLVVLWGGPIPALAGVSFSWHMILHLGVMVVAAPLVAIGLTRLGWGLPASSSWGAWAAAATLLDLAVVWGWHVPRLHELAALDDRFFAIQQASFLIAGMLLWLGGFSGGSRRAAAAGAAAMGLSFMHMSMLGVLLATAPALIYPPEICGGAWGLSPLDDQRLGGVMMAVAGALPYLAGCGALTARLLSEG